MAVKIQLRGDTSANLLLVNPILYDREMVVETDTNKIKIGDGVHHYADLPYASGGSGGGLNRTDVDTIYIHAFDTIGLSYITDGIYYGLDNSFYSKYIHKYCSHMNEYLDLFLFEIEYDDIDNINRKYSDLYFNNGEEFLAWFNSKNFIVEFPYNIKIKVYYYEDTSKQGITNVKGINLCYSVLRNGGRYYKNDSHTIYYYNNDYYNNFLHELAYKAFGLTLSSGDEENFSKCIMTNDSYKNYYKLYNFSTTATYHFRYGNSYSYENGITDFKCNNKWNFKNDRYIFSLLPNNKGGINLDIRFSNEITGNKINIENVRRFRNSVSNDIVRDDTSKIIIYKLEYVDPDTSTKYYKLLVKPLGIDILYPNIIRGDFSNIAGIVGQSLLRGSQTIYKRVNYTELNNNYEQYSIYTSDMKFLLTRNNGGKKKFKPLPKVKIMLNYGNGIFSKLNGDFFINTKSALYHIEKVGS